MEKQTILVLGANGKAGGRAAEAFARAGWHVRRFDRAADSLDEAAQGADVIFNGLNPPNYKGWDTALPQITRNVIAAAKSSGATVLLPGNVYVYAKEGGTWSEQTKHKPETRKGAIRAAMQASYREAANEGVQTIVLRAGDFIDAGATGTWLDLIILKKLARDVFTYPGKMNVNHSWAYLPDLARAMVGLAERRSELASYEDVPFPGFTLQGSEVHALVEEVSGRRCKVAGVPWTMIRIASPFWPLGRELAEMQYLWDVPHSLDGSKLARLLPGFEFTSPRSAFAAATEALGLGRAKEGHASVETPPVETRPAARL